MTERFWLVWADGGGRPTYKHPTRASAETEAARLARAHGGTFHVLECVGSCERPDVKWTYPEPVGFSPPVETSAADRSPGFTDLVREVEGCNEGICGRPPRFFVR